MQNDLLSLIESPRDLRKIPLADLPQLAEELRAEIIQVVAAQEGHLGASLGVVELTIALHYVFNTPEDVLVWDVGHQAYGHKMLTGRRKDFVHLRQWGGISGFPKREESAYDPFGTGHSSTAISAVLGMALANQTTAQTRQHIAVIGDASIASGMAFEALNHLGTTQANVLVILNDNAMGIDPSVGALKQFFEVVASQKDQQENIFTHLNIAYSGPIDGHDLTALVDCLLPYDLFLEVYILKKEEGGRHTPFHNNYRPQFYVRTTDVTGNINLPDGVEMVMPGDNLTITVDLISPIALSVGLRFAIREGGRTVGAGQVTELLD